MPQETKASVAPEPTKINAGLIIFLAMVLVIVVAIHQHLEQQLVSVKTFERETGLHFGNWPILLCVLFVPVLDCLLHGQYSVLIVMFYALAYSQLRKGHSFWGGALLGLATLKFQLVLGFVPIFLLKRKWRELAGFSASTAVLVALSLMMTGLQALHQYPNFALHAELPVNELPHKANWQGLLSFINQQGSIWVALLSVVTIIWAAHAWTNLDRGFCAATLATMLVSYHITPQDLSLAIVPFFVAVNAGILPRERVPIYTAVGMGILLLFMMVQIPMALFAIVLAACLAWVGTRRSQIRTHSGSTPAIPAV